MTATTRYLEPVREAWARISGMTAATARAFAARMNRDARSRREARGTGQPARPVRSPQPAPANRTLPTPAPTGGAPMVPLALVQACNAAGFPALSAELIAAAATPAEVQARIVRERTQVQQRQQKAELIRAACALARQPELAAGFIAGGMSLDQVRAQLLIVTAKLDCVEIDTSIKPEGRKRGATVDRRAAYANANGTGGAR